MLDGYQTCINERMSTAIMSENSPKTTLCQMLIRNFNSLIELLQDFSYGILGDNPCELLLPKQIFNKFEVPRNE